MTMLVEGANKCKEGATGMQANCDFLHLSTSSPTPTYFEYTYVLYLLPRRFVLVTGQGHCFFRWYACGAFSSSQQSTLA